ncbi:type I glyceraldehyde-3-phosphate dehydrogenase [Flavobacterium branchiophilum NBRC 15030 = ATCC 35035]|uniref:Glyceraldehyde-3-phosphate dehydrogenase n=1 Tax=Flavobacterium branchiophilum TaxID=55197 RepID=A0A2H3KBR5_9FLAO|nr:glyceraldehyde-3-phosphate dehydrogenase [Flavobacterium branchiophilum]OXA79763.1 type I glyceraldehyde-3-phosphate dehydrogenase [Flavobacterium branchiophilum NBRC 15030 = ATCC 35035]PDS24603.1 glyceraldehyde-3-phosphate dehydrogenase [Flavobacterium branchiophilum]TQM41302.1 glyceraldehyde 3-phosphate dehydrogenase [Flavobacterium branchiophilum]GEM56095.1 glyceraldehyde-3-phosphate dehydrogenase [Flavobacterium branchiophilum NBRC 15030 = ATCC 35035]
MTTIAQYEKELSFQADRRRAGVELIKIVSDLWYEKSIEMVLFRNQLIDKNVSEIINLHEYAGEFVGKPISVFDSVEIAKAILTSDLPPSKLDIGKLTFEFHDENNIYNNAKSFVVHKLQAAKDFHEIQPKDVVLYGFGRIGRLLARELMSKMGQGNQMRLRAIVTRDKNDAVSLEKRASLLRYDSVHGDFQGSVVADAANNALIINGTTVHIITANSPEEIDYTTHGISDALVIDNTGAFTTEEALSRHLTSKGVSKVLLTAPGKGVPNIVHGVNHTEFDPDEVSIFSAASCTTNAITPILKAVEDTLGVVKGHLETIHAYTNDQNLVDNMHKKYRRGRAAGLNMVITETGAGSAVAKALPSLTGKLTSNAIRVPVPNGSLVVLNLEVAEKTSKEGVNAIMKKYALEGELVEQIKYSMNNELVSSDIVGTSQPAIYDSNATIVSADGKNVVLYIWYDNEYGYSHQVIRLAKYISKVRRFTYY